MHRLIEECWDPETVIRPTFSEIIIRLDKIVANCSKHGGWKDTFKLPWYVSLAGYPRVQYSRLLIFGGLIKSYTKLTDL